MEDPPPNSELGLQLDTTAAAASDTAWHVLALLLSLGHPTLPEELASKCKLFYLTPEFVLYLCSIPNSPLRLAEDHSVTISQTGFAAMAQFLANSDTPTYLDLPQFVPRLLESVWSNGVLRTYSRKRKRLTSEVDELSVMRNRCYFQDFNVDKNLNKMLLTMPDAVQNIYDQGNLLNGNMNKSFATMSHVSPILAFDRQKLEKVMFTRSLYMNYCSGRLDYEILNADHVGSEMEDNFFSREKLCYLPWARCQPDYLFGGRLQNLLTPKLAEKIMISILHPEPSLIPCVTDNSEVSKDGEMDIINPITNTNHSNSCWLQEQKMTVSQVEGEAGPCESLIENVDRDIEEVLPPDSDKCIGHKENLPMVTTHIDEYHIDDPGKTLSEANNVVLFPNRTRTEVHLQSHRDMLKHQVKSSSVSNADQKDAANYKKKAVCRTTENLKCTGPLKEEPQTHRRDKKPIPVKQKTKCNADLHIKTKGKREKPMEHRKNTPSTSINNHIEQKPFPNFESFIVQEEEGSGGYGTVYRARRKSDGVTFAIKCPHVNAHRNIVHNELKMLERLGGKNFVIKYEGSIKSGSSDCLVLEHVEHDRPEVLKREINIFQLQWYGYCLFRALAGLHKQGIVHRDVKPGNFLFSRTVNKGYLIDFNLALDLNKKYGSNDDRKAGHDVNFDSIPIPRTKSLPPAKERKFTNTSVPQAANQNSRKSSKSILPPGNLKKKADQPIFFTDSSSRNIIRTQGTDGSGITSTKDATSTRTPSAERLREPVPSQGRKELISLVQEALQGGNNESVNAPTSKRKRVAAPPRNAECNFLYPTPMPLHARGMAIGGAGLLKSNGKHKREGPCVGTKGFRAPEVLFRSLYQGPKVDIWSAGVTLLYLMIGRTPFFGEPDENIKEIAKMRGSEDLWEVAKLHNHESLFPTDLLDVKHLSAIELRNWCAQNTRRPDFLEAIPRSLFDLVDKCLTVNPRLRVSAEEALRHEFFTPCHEALRKQRLQRQGVSLDTGTSRLLLHRESQSSEVIS
ncbi:hypothetical protein BUALT_Bualt10G0017500 [Buddleja alternifolia]|uniref:non-specific serine/threonine protein kinase n=1 Tax=Buddleja alternifolia TaxID=168488 RepID=A0AAV6X3C2_9LAMI|nr:hypothetical protein BUALT_Bualt10G0017500 [Buddleja alternifolia]